MSITYPAAPRRPERNEVGGLVFDDPYQWLEDDDGDGVAAWQRAQDDLARSYVHAWPHYDRLAARVGELVEQMDARNLVVPVRHGPDGSAPASPTGATSWCSRRPTTSPAPGGPSSTSTSCPPTAPRCA
ncbi:hypothetical protein BKM31_24495 [[Actinomadura] parvosata subsp. kistnae]|uniref:Peptidase S9A N-terminal domain-containing protein n=1 Tax=[Actinomadura] parvosata subsp. kistnae TaxID=1909395 RepID=A0A1V0A223_9ACTN|nr:hypothetical protein [Nonomuraea sp. ATCC 55076]AQZ64202.1 hypothetical protein BKM31_24495 [Nonomuraea sp. ATCC 55076]